MERKIPPTRLPINVYGLLKKSLKLSPKLKLNISVLSPKEAKLNVGGTESIKRMRASVAPPM
jgi:hypothetical protein